MMLTHRDGPHTEGHHVSGGGDRDGGPGVSESLPHPPLHTELPGHLDLVQAGHDHEHVVYTDGWNTKS